MQLYTTTMRMPGGLLVIPMMMGMLFNSLFPCALDIGSFTTALFKTGATSFVALICFICSTQIRASQAATPLLKGGALLLTKIVLAVAVGLGVSWVYGIDGILGLTPLALIPALSNASESPMLVSLLHRYESKT